MRKWKKSKERNGENRQNRWLQKEEDLTETNTKEDQTEAPMLYIRAVFKEVWRTYGEERDRVNKLCSSV